MMKKGDRRLSVLVVDDHPVVRAGLRAMIDAQPDLETVAEGGNGEEAIDLFRRHQPAITLVEAIETLHKSFPDACILVLTTYDGDEDIYRALHAGARAYLLKDMPREALLETIRAVHAGAHRLPPEVAARLAERMHQSELTSREIEIVEHIASGLSNKQIAAALGIGEATVKTHVNNIMGKLGANDRTHAVTIALRRGFIRL
jgi:DNA-binding NarL/FixJ family response regulator